jgi:general secretion pathway protein L
MSQTLLLRLPSASDSETEWSITDELGGRAGPRQRGPLTLAAALCDGRRVVAIAPATQVLIAEPVLPPGSGAKLARAVPFALEEQLTEDLADLHFALGRREDREGTPVAVVTRSAMDEWLEMLSSAGIKADAIYVDIDLLPVNPGHTVLWLEGERLAVRRPAAQPFVIELSPIEDALALAGVLRDPEQKTGDSISGGDHALVYLTQDDWARVQAEFERLVDRFASVKIQLLAEGPLSWLARELPRGNAIDLLQGPYALQTSLAGRWREWRLPAYLAAGLLAAHVGVQGLSIWKAKREARQLDSEIAQVFSASMPGQSMNDPLRQMQNRLKSIHGAGPQQFLHSLDTLGRAVSGTPKASIDALSYRDQTMDVKVTAPSSDALGQLSRLVSDNGMHAQIQSSNPVGDGVEGRLQLQSVGGVSR